MNAELEAYARRRLKEDLVKIPEKWQETFKLMYGRNKGRRSVEDAKAMPINDVVDEMDSEKLDWAMTQLAESLKKLEVQNGI